MDFEALLKKYIKYVLDVEGCDYIEHGPWPSDVKFTSEEWAALEKAAEARRGGNGR